MEKIDSTIETVLKNLLKNKTSCGEDVFEKILKKLLTKQELKHIKLNNFKNGVLSIKVDSSAWIYKFSLKKEELLKAFKLENSEVKDIRFYLGEIK